MPDATAPVPTAPVPTGPAAAASAAAGSPSTAAAGDRFPLLRLLVIAGAIFSSVTSEFLPTGLILDMAEGLDVGEAQIGFLVTIFAGTVVVSTAPLTLLTRRFPRKGLMVAVLLVFVAANILVAVAPSYGVVVVARVLGGLAHGLFWAVTTPYAARLVAPRQLARALSITSAGGTAAVVFGVPIGTVLGQLLGWRLAFLAVGLVVLGFTVLVVLFLPPVQHLVPVTTGEIPVPARRDRSLPAIAIVCATTFLLIVGHQVFATFTAPWVTDVARFPETAVGPMLFAFGAAGAGALVASGLLGDRFPRGFVIVCILIMGASVTALLLGSAVPPLVIAGIVVWGFGFGAIPSMMHTRMMQAASPRMRDLGAAWLTVAFNAAIGGGALAGGLLSQRAGYGVLPVFTLALLGVALAAMLATDRRRLAAGR